MTQHLNMKHKYKKFMALNRRLALAEFNLKIKKQFSNMAI